MNQITPFSLRIFVADGDPDGLRIVDKSNWIGKALVFPRALLPQVKARPELAQTGVYLLLGPRPDGEGDMLYVGEGDPIRPRLESHYAQKDFWTRAIGFTTTTAGQLNKAHVQFLESRLIALAPAAKAGPVLTCKGKGVQATGYEASQGFVVRAGSQAVVDSAPSMAQHVRGMFDLRQELISNGVLAMQGALFQFTQDYTFSAPSTAAAVVLGRSANGRVEWKAADGRTLKEIQEAEAGQ